MVVCPRTGDVVGPPLLALDASPEVELCKFEELLVVAAWKKVGVFRKETVVDEGEKARYFRMERRRNGGKLDVREVKRVPLRRFLEDLEEGDVRGFRPTEDLVKGPPKEKFVDVVTTGQPEDLSPKKSL